MRKYPYKCRSTLWSMNSSHFRDLCFIKKSIKSSSYDMLISTVCVHFQKFSSDSWNHVLPSFDPIALPSKLFSLSIDLNFLLPNFPHIPSVLIMTRLFQLDVPEEHCEGFVDVVQNWSGVPWENLKLVLNNVMTPDLAKIKCSHLCDDTWWMEVTFVYIHLNISFAWWLLLKDGCKSTKPPFEMLPSKQTALV